MSDCRFGVSPVNYPDPDPEETSVFSENTVIFILKFNQRGFMIQIHVCIQNMQSYMSAPVLSNLFTCRVGGKDKM